MDAMNVFSVWGCMIDERIVGRLGASIFEEARVAYALEVHYQEQHNDGMNRTK